jgi:hypothetical protein
MIELDEPDTSFGQPPSQQAIGSERTVATLAAVQLENVLRLLADVHQFRDAGLHAEREFVLADSRGDFGIIEFLLRQAVQSLDGVDDVALPLTGDALGIADVQHGVAGPPKFDSLKLAGQEAGMPLPGGDRLLLAELPRRHHHDEARQAFGFGAQSILQP